MTAKILIFVPAFGEQWTTATALSTHALAPALAAKGIFSGITSMSFPDIAELRNMATTIWYDTTDYSHILFIDSDMGFTPELIFDMLLFDEPVVGGCYPKRTFPTAWTPSGSGEAQATRRGDFMQVEGVGMGVGLIRRDAVSTILERMPELSDPRLHMHPAAHLLERAGCRRIIRCFDKMDIPERGIISEDLAFCLRWGQCGGTVWTAIGHRISHVGPMDYGARYLDFARHHVVTLPMGVEPGGTVAPGTAFPEPVPSGDNVVQLRAAE